MVPTEQEAGWIPEPVWMLVEGEKLLTLPGFKPHTVQPVA